LDLEGTPPKQKLQMLQNAVGDVEALAQVELMNDHDIARGHPPLTYERYVQVYYLPVPHMIHSTPLVTGRNE
jgi:hypothetical protein